MGEEERQRHEAAQQRVGVQQVDEVADVLVPAVDRARRARCWPRPRPTAGREAAADDDGPLPAVAPRLRVVLAPELERDAAEDERDEDEEEREVEAAEERRVPLAGRRRRWRRPPR